MGIVCRIASRTRDLKDAALEGTESFPNLAVPVILILGQQSYLAVGRAAVRVIVRIRKT